MPDAQEPRAGASIRLDAPLGAPEQVHVFGEDEVLAVQTARDARRALLIRGEPGTGKTQLAKAAAQQLGHGFVSLVVDSRTEARDLLWHVDAVRRLADAQVAGALPAARRKNGAALEIRNYVEPRPLWWGLNWESAAQQAGRAGVQAPRNLPGCDPANGVVVLIDEVDKGGADVPNGLLEALGSAEFRPPGFAGPVRPQQDDRFPLVIITTNDTRTLPDAFTRRCVVLHLRLPDAEAELIEHLVVRGAAHFPKMDLDVRRAAAEMVARDRARLQESGGRPLPGQAEYMDLLRVVDRQARGDAADQLKRLSVAAPFVVRKHLDVNQRP